MRTRVGTTLFAFLALVSLSCDDNPGTVDVGPWSDVFSGAANFGYLSSVWGSSADDVFLVGGLDAQQGVIYNGSGSDFVAMSLPDDAPMQNWVFGFGGDDVYSVGFDGSFLKYDGSSWESIETGVGDVLWGVWGTSPTDLWMVGGSFVDDDPVILRWDGNDVTSMVLPPEANPFGLSKTLFKVFGLNEDVYAVGQAGLIVRFRNNSWEKISAGESADQDFISLWGTTEDDLTVVGGRTGPRVASYDGSAFNTYVPTGNGIANVSAVFVTEDTTWVGGQNGYIGHLDSDSQEIEVLETTEYEVHDIWSDGKGSTYAVGGLFSGDLPGVAKVQLPK